MYNLLFAGALVLVWYARNAHAVHVCIVPSHVRSRCHCLQCTLHACGLGQSKSDNEADEKEKEEEEQEKKTQLHL